MKTFTGWEYLLIDVANNSPFGLDKKTFEERIQWATENLAGLETAAEMQVWKARPLYLKAVQAIRAAQRGEPSGHMVGLDAVCSGMQLMSVLVGCVAGATATGLVDPDHRADAYTDCTGIMNRMLMNNITSEVARADIKQATMTALYGSKAEPKAIFGEDTVELETFYKALYELSPGACELLQALLESWNAGALVHEWQLPDGYDARVKVMQTLEKRIEVDELNHASFTYQYRVNEGEEKGVKNAANVIHSIDAYVLRCMIRRCNYDRVLIEATQSAIEMELLARNLEGREADIEILSGNDKYYVDLFERTKMADIVMVPHLTYTTLTGLSVEHLTKLNQIMSTMLEHKPFPIVTVHDDFRAHPNNLNWLRKHYRNILAELAESDTITDILRQLYKNKGTFPKFSTDLPDLIRQSNYALC